MKQTVILNYCFRAPRKKCNFHYNLFSTSHFCLRLKNTSPLFVFFSIEDKYAFE